MALLFISFLAGVLTVLSPCILPLLPVIIGSSIGGNRRSTPYLIIGGLSLSIFVFTFLLKVFTVFISIPNTVWTTLSGGILVILGIITIFPTWWENIKLIRKINTSANKLLGKNKKKNNIGGDLLAGAALGPIFSACSPTYFVIIATVLPANIWLGVIYLVTYIVGLVIILIPIAFLGQKFTSKLQGVATNNSWLKKVMGLIFIFIGVAIINGWDKKIEQKILEKSSLRVINFEQKLLDKTIKKDHEPKKNIEAKKLTPEKTMKNSISNKIPKRLQNTFPKTDFSKTNPDLAKVQSGGPAKDGIPALDKPKFIPIKETKIPDKIQALVLISDKEVKAYPYNILIWHEIINDTFNNKPVAITFCPLCGSAIVYNRTLPDNTVTTFGVSGFLLESNMIMYDRKTESLWRQSTGESLTGSFYPSQLKRELFQLITVGEIKSSYPDAKIVSTDTGYSRDYFKNPYAGYEDSDNFIFKPSSVNEILPPKTIVVVINLSDKQKIVIPWKELKSKKDLNFIYNDTKYRVLVNDNSEIKIIDDKKHNYLFYFEMWFSFSVQHSDIKKWTLIRP